MKCLWLSSDTWCYINGLLLLVSQWTGSERCSKHGLKMNRLFFMNRFVGQQTDLEQYSKPYWQPMKGTKQWITASKKEVTLSQSRPVDSDLAEGWWGQCLRYYTRVNCNNQDDKTQEQLQVILHYPDQGDSERTTNLGYGRSLNCTRLIYVSGRWNFCQMLLLRFWADFAVLVLTPRSSIENWEYLLSFVPNKEELLFIWV